jgi:hypothetical protein
MSLADPAGPRVSLRRVVLLFLFGASACMALTPPGQWVASRLIPKRRPQAWTSPYLESAPHTELLALAVMDAFSDMLEDADHPVGTLPVPTDAAIIERLAHFDCWSTCVVLELGSSPAEVESAGITDRKECVAIANAAGRLFQSPGSLEKRSTLPWRTWTVLMIDEQGRRVAGTSICSLRPGFELLDAAARSYAERPDAPGDGSLPRVRVFRRTCTGEIVTG